MEGLISVIVPIYDVEPWLDECIESIVNQSYTNLEIILIDDGSPDKCPQICDEWAKKDNRISVIHKKNGGLSSARNAGLEVCKGEYISFIDSDDFIHKDMYKIMLHDIKEKNVDVVKCSKSVYENATFTKFNKLDAPKYYDREEILDCYFYHKEDFCGGAWDKLYKAELFDDVRFPEGINSEDYYMYAKIYSKINKLYYNDISLYYYRVRENSICSTNTLNSHSYDKIIICDMVKEFVDNQIPERAADAVAFQILGRYSTYYDLMKKEHEKSVEKEWKRELRKYRKKAMKHKKLSMSFKIKYLLFSTSVTGYIKMQKVLKKY
ncbi:MAG: glycosyltransferase family 2 protein [Eubacterium sp.]